MKKLILFCFVLPAIAVSGQSKANQSFDHAHRLLLNHQFISLDNYIEFVDLTQEESIYLESFSEFMQLHLKGDREEIQSFSEHNKQRLKSIKDLSGKEARFVQSVLLFQSSLTHGRFKDYFTSAVKFREAYQITQKLIEQHPEYMPAKMIYGTMLVLFGSVPENYTWVLKLMNIEGKTGKGLDILDEVFQNQFQKEKSKYMEESLMLLTFSYCNFKPESSEIQKIYQYYKKPEIDRLITTSPMVRYSAVNLVKKLPDNEKALEYMQRSYPQKPEIPFYYLDFYLKGLSMLQNLDFDAKKYFEIYLDKYPGDIYKKAAIQKIAWIELLKNGVVSYNKAFERINNYSFDARGSDGAAQKEYEKENVPNTYLLKARLLFDGGYYEKSLKELKSQNSAHSYSSEKDQLEYIYRLGRIYHQLEQFPKAVKYYEMTIEQGKNDKYYFAANAALKLGKIYSDKKQYKKARQVFEDCLEMEPETYKSGIHRKAKAYLQEIPAK